MEASTVRCLGPLLPDGGGGEPQPPAEAVRVLLILISFGVHFNKNSGPAAGAGEDRELLYYEEYISYQTSDRGLLSAGSKW